VLRQNYPSPFNPHTRIEYDLPQGGLVRLAIFNALGQRVRTLIESSQQAGFHRLDWDGRDDAGIPLRSGTYFYRLAMSQTALHATRSMVLAR
jgi:flagellar hook assembly protein FlgD